LLGLVELILKDRQRLHRLIRDPSLQPELIPRFLAISLIGFLFFGVAMTLVLNSAEVWPKLTAIDRWLSDPEASLISFHASESQAADSQAAQPNRWFDGSAFKVIVAYSLGLIAATGVCLPSLYFYGLLSGVRMSMLDVTIHALKAKATAAVALVGILPIYAAVSMGVIIFGGSLEIRASLLQGTLLLGLILPFLAGFWGTHSLYLGFTTLCDTMPPERRERRECFLRRLVLSWSVCYTVVTPVMIFTLWAALGTK
jgi:hypothetical protein